MIEFKSRLMDQEELCRSTILLKTIFKFKLLVSKLSKYGSYFLHHIQNLVINF